MYTMKKFLFFLWIIFIFKEVYPQTVIDDICIGETFLIDSKILNEHRRVFVYLPDEYLNTSYPVMYLLSSGRNDFRYNIFHDQFIVIGIESRDTKQDFLTATNRDNFCHFFEKELIPYVEANYKTLPIRFISGHSLSGAFVIDIFLKKPQLFAFFIATSPALNVLDTINIAETKLAKETGLYFNIGDKENYEQLEKANSNLHNQLKSSKIHHLNWKYERLSGENHETNAYTGFCRGYNYYKSLLSVPDSILGTDIQEIIDYSNNIQSGFGFKIEIDEYVVMPNILLSLKNKNYHNVIHTVRYISNELTSFFIEEVDTMIDIGNELQLNGQFKLALEVFQIIYDKTQNPIAETKMHELEKKKE